MAPGRKRGKGSRGGKAGRGKGKKVAEVTDSEGGEMFADGNDASEASKGGEMEGVEEDFNGEAASNAAFLKKVKAIKGPPPPSTMKTRNGNPRGQDGLRVPRARRTSEQKAADDFAEAEEKRKKKAEKQAERTKKIDLLAVFENEQRRVADADVADPPRLTGMARTIRPIAQTIQDKPVKDPQGKRKNVPVSTPNEADMLDVELQHLPDDPSSGGKKRGSVRSEVNSARAVAGSAETSSITLTPIDVSATSTLKRKAGPAAASKSQPAHKKSKNADDITGLTEDDADRAPTPNVLPKLAGTVPADLNNPKVFETTARIPTTQPKYAPTTPTPAPATDALTASIKRRTAPAGRKALSAKTEASSTKQIEDLTGLLTSDEDEILPTPARASAANHGSAEKSSSSPKPTLKIEELEEFAMQTLNGSAISDDELANKDDRRYKSTAKVTRGKQAQSLVKVDRANTETASKKKRKKAVLTDLPNGTQDRFKSHFLSMFLDTAGTLKNPMDLTAPVGKLLLDTMINNWALLWPNMVVEIKPERNVIHALSMQSFYLWRAAFAVRALDAVKSELDTLSVQQRVEYVAKQLGDGKPWMFAKWDENAPPGERGIGKFQSRPILKALGGHIGQTRIIDSADSVDVYPEGALLMSAAAVLRALEFHTTGLCTFTPTKTRNKATEFSPLNWKDTTNNMSAALASLDVDQWEEILAGAAKHASNRAALQPAAVVKEEDAAETEKNEYTMLG